MGTFTDTFYGEHPSTLYIKGGNISVQYSTADGTVTMANSSSSLEGYWYMDSRFLGNVTLEWSFIVVSMNTGATAERFKMGFMPGTAADPGVTNETCYLQYSSGDGSPQLVINSQYIPLTLGQKYWIKITQGANYDFTWEFKIDGGSYAQQGGIAASNWFFLEEYDGVKFCAYVNPATYSYFIDLDIHDLIVTSDQSDVLETWPSDFLPVFAEPAAIMSSGYADHVDDLPYVWDEPFDETYEPDNYNGAASASVADGVLRFYHDTSGYIDHSYALLSDLREIGGGDIDIRMKLRILQDCLSSSIELCLKTTANESRQVFYKLTRQAASTYGFSIQRYVNSSEGSGYLTALPIQFIPPTSWVWLRIKQNPDLTVTFYFRYDQYGDWLDHGTTPVPLDTDGTTAFFEINVTAQVVTEGEDRFIADVDQILVDSSFNAIRGDRIGSLDLSFDQYQNPQFMASDTYSEILSLDFSDHMQMYACYMDQPYPALSYLNDIYLQLDDNYSTPMLLRFASEGDLDLSYRITYVGLPDAPDEASGLFFTINEVEVVLGRLWDSVNSVTRMGVRIGDTFSFYSTHDPSYSALQDFSFKLIGNTLTVKVALDSTEETILTDSNFLGSPAEYICYRMRWVRDGYWNHARFSWMNLFGKNSLLIPNYGSLLPAIEIPVMSAIGIKTPPVPAYPGFFFHRTELTGGNAGAVDAIDPTNIDETNQPLTENSTVLVVTADNSIYLYRAHEQAGQSELLPDIIIPDNNPGDWYWERVVCEMFQPAIVQQYTDLLTAPAQSFDQDYLDANHFVTNISSTGLVEVKNIRIPSDGSGVVAEVTNHSDTTNITSIPFTPLRNT